MPDHSDRRDRVEAMVHAIMASPAMMDFCVKAAVLGQPALMDHLRKANPHILPIAAHGLSLCRETISLARLLVSLVDGQPAEHDPVTDALRRFEGPAQ